MSGPFAEELPNDRPVPPLITLDDGSKAFVAMDATHFIAYQDWLRSQRHRVYRLRLSSLLGRDGLLASSTLYLAAPMDDERPAEVEHIDP